jgi:hypothetical protein
MVIMNNRLLHETQNSTAALDGLAGMRAAFAQTASDPAMFGDVPNADVASAALEQAALTMLNELQAAGLSVEDIARSAGEAAGIGEASDAAAHQELSNAQREAEALDLTLDTRSGAAPPPGAGGR